MSFATMLINPAKQPAVPQNGFGFKALFIATSLFLISSEYRPLNYRVYRLSLDEPVPCQLIQFSIRFKHQIHINKDGIIRVVMEKNNG
jgi:hypothetical protein